PPRLSHRGSTCDALATDVEGAGRARGQHALVRHVATDRSAGQSGEEAEPERRLLLGVDVLHARHPDRSVHADLRRQPGLRLDRARARTARQQSPDPPARRLHRPRVSADVRPARSSLAGSIAASWIGLGPGRTPRTGPNATIVRLRPRWTSSTSAISP